MICPKIAAGVGETLLHSLCAGEQGLCRTRGIVPATPSISPHDGGSWTFQPPEVGYRAEERIIGATYSDAVSSAVKQSRIARYVEAG